MQTLIWLVFNSSAATYTKFKIFWMMLETPTFIRNKRFSSISYKVCIFSSIQNQISLVSKEKTEWICFQTWFGWVFYRRSALKTKLWRPDAETPAKNLPISARWFKLQLRMCDIIIRTSKAANRTSSSLFPPFPRPASSGATPAGFWKHYPAGCSEPPSQQIRGVEVGHKSVLVNF